MFPSNTNPAPVLLLVVVAGTGLGTLDYRVLAQSRPLTCPTGPPPRVDSHGDPLPDGAVARLGTVRLRHGQIISGAVFSGDGKSIIVSDFYSGVRVWDTATGKQVRRIFETDHYCHRLAISPDGRTLAVALGDLSVRLCDPPSGRELGALPSARDRLNQLVFSPDGALLATAAGGPSVRVYEVSAGKLAQTVAFGGNVGSVAFSSDAKYLAGGVRDGLSLWDLDQGRVVRELKNDPGSKDSLSGAFAANWGPLAVWGYEDGSVRLFDATGAKELRRLNREGPAEARSPRPSGNSVRATFCPNGQVLAVARDAGRIELWDAKGGKRLHTLAFDSSHLSTVLAFSPDGTKLASTGWDNWGGDNAIRMWDVRQGKELHPRAGHGAPIGSVAFVPDGHTVATAGRDGAIHLWDGSSGKHLMRLDGPHNRRPQVSFSADGRRLIAWGAYRRGSTLILADPRTGQAVSRLELQGPDAFWEAVSGDGRTAVSVDWKGKVDRFHDLTTGKVTREVPDDFLRPTALSPAGDKLVGLDGTLMTVADRKELLKIRGVYSGNASVRFSSDGRTLVAAAIPERSSKAFVSDPPAEEVVVVDVAAGRELRRFGKGDKMFRAIHAVALSGDGKTVVTVRDSEEKRHEQLITLWETETGRERGSFRGHTGRVNGLAVSADGRLVVSGADDTSALVWDATRPPTGHAAVRGGPAAADLAARFRDLAGDDAELAHASLWALVNAPREAVAFLGDRTELFAATDVEKIRQWIRQLDNNKYADRERASQELGLVLDEAEPHLRKALDGRPSAEARRRIELLLQARAAGTTGRELQRLRVIEALEHVAAEGADPTRDAAVGILRRFAARVPGPRPAEEAKASLARLDRRADVKR